LYNAGVLHRDISVRNMLISDGDESPVRGFLIDLDLAIRTDRETSTNAGGMTGTRVFMAIGALRGKTHTFVHDLESFFWVLFWLCVHYPPDQLEGTGGHYESWNYMPPSQLADSKFAILHDNDGWDQRMGHVTPYYASLRPCLRRLRDLLATPAQGDRGLYAKMKGVLADAMEDPLVANK
jgi:hypothetical protein